MTHSRPVLVLVIGLCSLLPYLAARGLGDLRQNTLGFEVAFGGAFALYFIAVCLVLRPAPTPAGPPATFRSQLASPVLWLALGFGLIFRVALLPTRPTLSDDMYRYVWDGRVQAYGLSPYRYPPIAPEVASLRQGDSVIWPFINRNSDVTVYPPGAQLAFLAVWRVVGDSVTGFKAAFTLAELLGAGLLLALLYALKQPLDRVLIYLWSPLLVFEVAQAGHVDGLMLPLLLAAFWARVKKRPWLIGIALGAATLVKLFPLLLAPALLPLGAQGPWRERLRPAAKTLLGFAATVGLGYLPYLLQSGGVVGFLPRYFNENFNLGLAKALFVLAPHIGQSGAGLANAVTFGGLVLLSAWFVLRPAADGQAALWRCVWVIGWFTMFTQNLFPWYLLWLLPLFALFVEPGSRWGLKLAPATAWLVYSGSIALAYMFFVHWRVVAWAQVAEYAPLYGLLVLPLLPRARAGLARLALRIRDGRRAPSRASA